MWCWLPPGRVGRRHEGVPTTWYRRRCWPQANPMLVDLHSRLHAAFQSDVSRRSIRCWSICIAGFMPPSNPTLVAGQSVGAASCRLPIQTEGRRVSAGATWKSGNARGGVRISEKQARNSTHLGKTRTAEYATRKNAHEIVRKSEKYARCVGKSHLRTPLGAARFPSNPVNWRNANARSLPSVSGSTHLGKTCKPCRKIPLAYFVRGVPASF